MVLLVVGGFLYAQSFERWGDPIIDLGRDLHVPLRLLEGDTLYRDITYNYGPVAPYALALVVLLFGDGLRVLEAVGLLVGLSAAAGLYLTGQALGSRVSGFAAALLFLVFSMFARSTFGCNFVLPYSFGATMSAAFAVWSFHFLLRHLSGGGMPHLWTSVGFMLAALFAKVEYGAAILAVHAAAYVLWRVRLRTVLAVAAVTALAVALFVAAFSARAPGEHALLAENLARFSGNESARGFFSSVAGFDRPLERVFHQLTQALALVTLVGLGAGVSWLLLKGRGESGNRPRLARWRGLLALVAAVCFGLAVWWLGKVSLFEGIPLAAACLLIYTLAADRRSPMLLLCVFALASAPRVLLNYSPAWYGFYLVVPSYLLAPYFIAHYLPRTAAARRSAAVLLLLVAAAMALRWQAVMAPVYASMTGVIQTPKGRMHDASPARAQVVSDFVRYAHDHGLANNATAVVFPEGVSLNYFTGMTNPTAYYNFIPPEVSSPEEERRMLAALEKAAPDFVVVVSRDTREFGKAGFGVDYGLELYSWILRHYALETTFGVGATPGADAIVLLRRRVEPR